MGLPVSKEELPAGPEVPSPSTGSEAASSRESLTSLIMQVVPAFGALIGATVVDYWGSGSVRAVAAYCAAAITVTVMIRSSLLTRGLLTSPQREPYLAIISFAALLMTAVATVLMVFRAPFSGGAALHLLEFGAVTTAFALWFELRSFIDQRTRVLGDPSAGLLPQSAWTRASTDAPDVRTAPEALRPGDLCVCRSGEVVPADSTIESGIAVLWERTVSGRPRLRIRSTGDDLFAGSSILSGELVARVTAELEDSRITSFLEILRSAGRGEYPFMRALSGPGICALLFISACVVLGLHELQFSWDAAVLAGSSVLSCIVLVDICRVAAALPSIFMKRGFLSGVLFQTEEALAGVSAARELVIDHSSREPSIGMEVRDFSILDERLDRARIESALIAIFSRAGEDLAGAFERIVRTLPEQIFPCALADFHEYPGLGYSANVEGAEISVGSEEFLVARGVRIEPSEILAVLPGQQNIYVALGDEVVARFIYAEANLEPLALTLGRGKVQLRLYSAEDEQTTDSFGKRAGVELALIQGGLSADQYVERLRALKAPAILASGSTLPSILKAARVSISPFNPIRWNFERTPITIFGDDAGVVSSVFEIGRRFDFLRKAITVFGFGLAVLLLGLSIFARLTPATVLVAALSGITFVLLAAEERLGR